MNRLSLWLDRSLWRFAEIAGLLLGIQVGWAAPLRFERLPPPTADGTLLIRGVGRSNAVYRIERSSNLIDWAEWRRLIPPAGEFQIPDVPSQGGSAGFYRFRTAALTAFDDWKNQIQVPSDAFFTTSDQSQVRWIKFLILTQDPSRVYF